MFGWLKSLFGGEPEHEIVVPPLPSKVKKAEKIVSKKISKRSAPKKDDVKSEITKKETTKKESTKKTTKPKAPKVSKLEEETVQAVVDAEVKTTKKKGGRSKKSSV